MWYRVAIDLSNLKGFSPVETSVSEVSEKPLTEHSLHKSVSKFHDGRDEIDNFTQLGGLDPHSPFAVEYAETLLGVIGDVVPVLEGFLEIVEQGHYLKWINFILLRFTSANWIIEDTKNFINLCKRVEVIEDPRKRVSVFLKGIREIDGLFGFIANSVMIFNTIVKGLKEFSGLDINNTWTFAAYFYGAPIFKYLFEEGGDEEDKSGLKVIKTRVINSTLENLFKKNSDNRDLYKYIIDLMENNKDFTHEKVREESLKWFKDRVSKEDIIQLVDIVYEDLHDLIGPLRGKRVSKKFIDSFEIFMSDAGRIQMICVRASMAMSNIMDMLNHFKVASNQSYSKIG